MPKIQPAHLDLKFSLQTDGGNHVKTADIDIARALSAVNRRLYRQGMMYYVTGVSLDVDPSSVPIGALVCQTAPDTWVVHNAWKKAQQAWLKQQRDARANGLQSAKPKWEDFKVELDDSSTTVLETSASDTGTVVPDEWVLSKFVWDDDGTENEPTMNLLGSSDLTTAGAGVGLVLEYNRSRAMVQVTPNTHSTLSDSIYAKLHGTDELTDMLIDNMEDDNDAAPYDMDSMVGGQSVADSPFSVAKCAVSYLSPISKTEPFKVPCGLLRVVASIYQADGQPLTSGTLGVGFTVHLAPGPYKGVMAEPMGQ